MFEDECWRFDWISLRGPALSWNTLFSWCMELMLNTLWEGKVLSGVGCWGSLIVVIKWSGDDHGEYLGMFGDEFCCKAFSEIGCCGKAVSSLRSGATGIGRFLIGASVRPRLKSACATVDSVLLLFLLYKSLMQRFSASFWWSIGYGESRSSNAGSTTDLMTTEAWSLRNFFQCRLAVDEGFRRSPFWSLRTRLIGWSSISTPEVNVVVMWKLTLLGGKFTHTQTNKHTHTHWERGRERKIEKERWTESKRERERERERENWSNSCFKCRLLTKQPLAENKRACGKSSLVLQWDWKWAFFSLTPTRPPSIIVWIRWQ